MTPGVPHWSSLVRLPSPKAHCITEVAWAVDIGTACGQACANQTMFDPSKSSTFVDFDSIDTIEFTTGVGVDPVNESHRYALTLRAGQDTVTVGGLQAPNVSLNIITNQTATFLVDPFSGIQGKSLVCSSIYLRLIYVSRDGRSSVRILFKLS